MRLQVRDARSEDFERLKEIQKPLDERMGCEMDLPVPGEKRVLLYRVLERDGQVVGGYYFEVNIEICGVGNDPAVAAMMKKDGDVFLRNSGDFARYAICKVPEDSPKAIGKQLEKCDFEKKPYALYQRVLF